MLVIDHCSFQNVGHDSRNKYDAAISLYGVQEIFVSNSNFEETKDIKLHLVVGEPKVNITHLSLPSAQSIKVSGDQKYRIGALFETDDESSLGNDGRPLGYSSN